MDLLRFITAGSVDDGKSTLIGRLLYDSKNVLADQLLALEKKSVEAGTVDLALLTDGLRAEREQGITIDVAYKYFSTPSRKFIAVDAPGHIQYTRNMVTGASNCSLLLILIDARKGVIEQTRRHSLIGSVLGINEVIVAINKMDLVNFSSSAFESIRKTYLELAGQLRLKNVQFIPVSALQGDEVVEKSTSMPWYQGPPLLELLEQVPIAGASPTGTPGSRFQVQWVVRPQSAELPDYRGYAGKILSGIYKQGDKITVLPAGTESKILSIESDGKEVISAEAGENVIIRLQSDIDVSRGNFMIVSGEKKAPTVSRTLNMLVCWMDPAPLKPENRYQLQVGTARQNVIVKSINYKIDVSTLKKLSSPPPAELNELVHITLKASAEAVFDSFSLSKQAGSAILIDEHSLVTVGACMLD